MRVEIFNMVNDGFQQIDVFEASKLPDGIQIGHHLMVPAGADGEFYHGKIENITWSGNRFSGFFIAKVYCQKEKKFYP